MSTCKTCMHFRPVPTTAMTLGQPRQGRCQERIHSVGVPVPQPGGSIDILMKVGYPHVPEDMPACGQYQEVDRHGG